MADAQKQYFISSRSLCVQRIRSLLFAWKACFTLRGSFDKI